MASVITIAGEKLFAAKAQANEQLDIDTFIFANVPNQDPTAPINREEGIPTEHKVHEQIVQQVGRINDNVVVYSTVLDSLTGPFEFNWVGLYSSVNQTLVAINHIPATVKTITEPGVAGNTLNRNFGIEYSGIADLTGINVAPETWQLDFTARLGGMDKLTQQLAADMNGKDWFIEDGFKVVPRATANSFSVLPGVGYVSGLRIELKQEHILTLQSYPQFVYVDAWFSGTANSVWTPQVAFTVTNGEMDDYIDVQGVKHYVFKLAVVNAADDVEDFRKKKISGRKLFKTLSELVSARIHESEVGTSVEINERNFGGGGKSVWDIVFALPENSNPFNNVQSVGNPQISFKLRQENPVNLRANGITGGGITDDSDAFIELCSKPVNIIGGKDDIYLITKPIDVKDNSTIDGNGALIRWKGIAPPINNMGRDRGIFEVRGTLGSELDSVSTGDWKKGTDRFPISVGSKVPDTEFVKISAGSLPNAHIGYLIKPSLDQVDNNRIRADYFLGYTLINPTFRYTEVLARKNVEIKNFNIEDQTNGSDDEDISGVVLQFASNCHVLNINAKSTRNPVVFGHYTSDCSVRKGYLDTPSKTSGGKGYFVQWNNAVRCDSEKLTGKSTRHISDFTTAAFCKTEDCGGENTLSGEFVTHGAYEHNLDYIRTRGFLGFAGSGPTFGESAKNITVRNHIGSDIRARANVENLHLYDCETNYAVLNNVDLIVENLKLYDTEVVDGRLQLNNWSRRLGKTFTITKPAVIRDSAIKSADTVFLFEPDLDDDEINIENSSTKIRSSSDLGGGRITFNRGNVECSTTNIIFTDNITKLHFLDVLAVDLGFRTNTRVRALDFKIRGGKWSGANSAGQLFSFRDTGTVVGNLWSMEDAEVDWAGPDTIESPSSFSNPNWDIKLINNQCADGNLTFRPAQRPFRSIANVFKDGANYTPFTLGMDRISEHNIILNQSL
ncbi:phage tail-collar fiber domain-containing protein [Shewanella sp. 30m-9]